MLLPLCSGYNSSYNCNTTATQLRPRDFRAAPIWSREVARSHIAVVSQTRRSRNLCTTDSLVNVGHKTVPIANRGLIWAVSASDWLKPWRSAVWVTICIQSPAKFAGRVVTQIQQPSTQGAYYLLLELHLLLQLWPSFYLRVWRELGWLNYL